VWKELGEPLAQVLTEALGRGEQTKTVRSAYDALIAQVGPEIRLLMDVPLDALTKASGEQVAEGVARVRAGQRTIQPGYDGTYGKVRIWPEGRG
jgi:PHP family Zn ribbon phosphoesterase